MTNVEKTGYGELLRFFQERNFDGIMGRYGSSVNNALHLKYPTMDGQMNRYMERADNNDRTCIRVDMNDGKRIDFSENLGEADEAIFTFGLCGCIATALALKMKDDTIRIILTHNSPLTALEGSQLILSLSVGINPEEVEKAKVFILAPGEWKKDSDNKWKQEIKSSIMAYVDLLEVSAKIVGGINTEVEKIGYSENIEDRKINQGTFRIMKGEDKKVKFIIGNYDHSGEIFS